MRSTVTVRRVAGLSPTGTETLSAPVSLAAYVEQRRENAVVSGGVERRTSHLVVLDHADVAASTLGIIQPEDRFWLEDDDTANETRSRRPEGVASFKDPITGSRSHWEVTL